MRFCPKCGSLMIPRREGGAAILYCPRCGHKIASDVGTLTAYKTSAVLEHTEKERTIVISEGEGAKGLPITRDVICPKCGNHEAYYWLMQTRAADEPATRFFKCTRCGHVWREYD